MDDLIEALAGGGYDRGPREDVNAVPEPASFTILSIALLMTVSVRRLCQKPIESVGCALEFNRIFDVEKTIDVPTKDS